MSSSRRAPRPLSFALADLSATLAPPSTIARVQACWASAVGDVVASVSAPIAERGGALIVRCESAVWSAELDLMADDLLACLNAALGEDLLHKLRCRTG